MSLPIVAIVGRPNVGKSSILNCLTGKKIAIVDPTPGVTRDRLSAPCPVGEGYVELVDTGGMGVEDIDKLTEHIETQIAFAVEAAALILFVVDAREGVTPLDHHVAVKLRKSQKPVLLLANKVDQANAVFEQAQLFQLGFGEPLVFSAKHSVGRSNLLEAIAKILGDEVTKDRPPQAVMKLAIVGKRNAGKSTFINALAGEERVIVSETPGTTRDSVDVHVKIGSKTITLIDTAGVRKRKSFSGDIEFYSHHRAMRSIRRADVVALMIDASVPLSQVDKDLAGTIAEELKPVVLVVNKWDKAQGKATVDDYEEYLNKMMPELAYAPISLTAAKDGLNVHETIRVAEDLFHQASTRVPTHKLNEAIEKITGQRAPSHKSGSKPPKLYYASQIATCPPTIVCFVNDAKSFDNAYQRFLLNGLREYLPFGEVPIRLFFRGKPKETRKGNPEME